METALIIVALIACIMFIILAFVAIGTLDSLKKFVEKTDKSISSMTSDFNSIKVRLLQTLEEVSFLKGKLSTLIDEVANLKGNVTTSLSSIDSLAKTIEDSAENFSEKSDILFRMLEPIEYLTRIATTKLTGPVLNSVAIISATGKAISAFSGKLFSKK